MIPLLIEGLLRKEIADVLHISKSTVNYHVRNIFRKCGVTNRASLIAIFGHFEVDVHLRWVPSAKQTKGVAA